MKKLLLIFYLLCFVIVTNAQEIPSYSFGQLEEKIAKESEKHLLVVNFWATWCAPCIKELPYFEDLSKDYSDDKLKVLLVSLDMEKEKAVRFCQKKQLKSEVIYLEEVDFNAWINKISPEWSGAIPATLIIAAGGKQIFHEGALSKEELYNHINRFINKTEKL